MSDDTKIEWADATWNPVRGCTRVSEGCRNCYAERVAARFSGPGQPYDGLTEHGMTGPRWTGEVTFVESALFQPLRWKRPRRIFVNSMSDLFHGKLPDAAIDRIFAVMALTPQHTFMVLTKRPERMRVYMEPFSQRRANGLGKAVIELGYRGPLEGLRWPLPNCWLGVSVEDQATADARVPHLLLTPAAVRFISAEPLLGPVDLRGIYTRCPTHDFPSGFCVGPCSDRRHIDWVIVGGESGPGARPMHPDWARSLRDQCATARVPFFFKQWGSWAVTYDRDRDDPDWRRCDNFERSDPKGRWLNLAGGHGFHGDRVVRVTPSAKADAGRLLDGVTHDARPEHAP
jgi:protein gp37